jgi:ABC-type transport system involved in multi-copper enzyme maturation permease subunit
MMDSMQRIRALATIIFLDGMRRHAVIGLILLALLSEFFGLVFVDFFVHDLGRAVSDFLFSAMWVTGLIFLFFHAVQVMAWDEEHKVIFGIISRPISRNEYLVGVGLGLAALLFVLEATLGVIAYATLFWLHSSISAYFEVFNHWHFLMAWAGLVVSLLVVLSAILFFSGVVRGGFAVLIISVAYYFICSGLPMAREHIASMIEKGSASEGLGYFLQALSFLFPDLNRMDYKNEVLTEILTVNATDVLIQGGLALSYMVLMLMLACFAYGKRDIQ